MKNKENKEDFFEAGRIARKVKEWAKTFIKKDMFLIEIAEKIEEKIFELGGKPAFPVNLSIDKIAAHYTPSYNDKTVARGLLKVDFGVHVNGCPVDNSFSLDLENSKENKKLIEACEKALEASISFIKEKIESKEKIKTNEIGEIIQKKIESFGFYPIVNLSGHSIEKYNLHSGISIPNFNEKKEVEIEDGIYAIEPFATTGTGKVHDGNFSGIYKVISEKQPRSEKSREVFKFILEEYKTLPFCSRWIYKKFGSTGLLSLKELESNGNLHHFKHLLESEGSKVSQAEHTILIEKDNFFVLT
ncbi:MAG: type II methionyl aminopeptidase [Candidatus Pacearchaeota archaeon]|nr:MAG: type II methionyl aminopeptidase [Candidatus Pacearchaeota archaeon]